MVSDEKIVELYEQVQELPYRCLKVREPDNLMEVGEGSCLEKNVYLGKEYEELDIPVKYYLIEFDWRELPVPERIVGLLDDPHGEHLALEIKRGGKWITVDASWDPGLESAGFPVTEDWDGRSDTKLAVEPLEKEEMKERPGRMRVDSNQQFFQSLNEWLEEQRDR